MEGNQIKMREALEFAERQLRDATESNEYGSDVVYLVGCMRTVAAACRAALSAPARQCDVGTVEEQRERFKAFCRDRQHGSCYGCPIPKKGFCTLQWSQTPYEAQEGGAA